MLDLSQKKLEVYQLSLSFIKDVYELTGKFPKHEFFVLVTQIRRAAISINSNIAEGASRTSLKEKKRFYEIARGSAVEIDTQLEIAIQLNYYSAGSVVKMEQTLASIFRILSRMISNLNLSVQKQ